MGLFALPPIPEFDQVPTWQFTYSPCGFIGLNSTGPTSGEAFLASVNASSGAVLSAKPQEIDCQQNLSAPPPSIFSALSLQNPELVVGTGTGGTIPSQGCTSGDYCYELIVGNATSMVEPQDFSLSVDNSTGEPSTIPTGFAILSPAGQVIVYSLGDAEMSWADGVGNATTPLEWGSMIWIDMGTTNPAGQDYFLQVQGQGPYADSAAGYSLP